MVALALAGLYFAWLHYVNGTVFEGAYYQATNFLFWWRIVLLIIWCITITVMGILTAKIVAVVDAQKKLGKTDGIALGTGMKRAFSGFNILVSIFRQLLYIGGAYLLHTALVIDGANYAFSWSRDRLFCGAILLVLFFAIRVKSKRGKI